MDQLKIATVSNNIFNLPLWIGLEEDVFTRNDLDISIMVDESVDAVTNALSDSEAQIARGITEHVIIDQEMGGDLEIIAGSVNKLPFNLISNPNIQALSALKGKVIGVSSPEAGSSSLIMKILENAGLRYPEDYEIRKVGPMKGRWELLQSNEIDCGLQGIPYNLLALDDGYIDLCDPSEHFPDFQFSSYNILGSWGRENSNLVIRFLTSLIISHEWMYANREKSAKIISKNMGISFDYAVRAWNNCITQKIMPVDCRASLSAVKTLLEVSGLIRALVKRTNTSPEDYLNDFYIDSAHTKLSQSMS